MDGPGKRDHGGGIDAAIATYGGSRKDWLDLSTGINPEPYPLPDLPADVWTALPDQDALNRLLAAARRFWNVPGNAQIIAAPGASALIAAMPVLARRREVQIPGPTYNEHAAAFRVWRYEVHDDTPCDARVLVHPNNPDGKLWATGQLEGFTLIDESFCDVTPGASFVDRAAEPGVIVLKSFGKFWGLAGVRLGFAIGLPETLNPGDGPGLTEILGPWAVSGPALAIGATALKDQTWATATRARLKADAARLDALIEGRGARVVGGTTLFRLYDVTDAAAARHSLAEHHILSRSFPYSNTWLRLGIPPASGWDQLETALLGASFA
ncbi:MAG: threonine-phosphate decarboxylase [Pseudomonadota bacterium]